jgi:hypothetical protein
MVAITPLAGTILAGMNMTGATPEMIKTLSNMDLTKAPASSIFTLFAFYD